MNVFERLISLVAPHDCIVCGLEGNPLCVSCLNAELAEAISRCYRCHKISSNQTVCVSCRKSVPIRHVWVATDYREIPKKLIYKLKFERAIAAAEPIAAKIDQILPILPDETVVCHIPTVNSRIRRRGYDQAQEIAKHLADIRGYTTSSLLNRTGSSRQVGSARKDRFKHLQNAFQVKRPDLKGAKVLLVDDVTTTGATIESAARALKKAGAKSIDVVVFAQPNS